MICVRYVDALQFWLEVVILCVGKDVGYWCVLISLDQSMDLWTRTSPGYPWFQCLTLDASTSTRAQNDPTDWSAIKLKLEMVFSGCLESKNTPENQDGTSKITQLGREIIFQTSIVWFHVNASRGDPKGLWNCAFCCNLVVACRHRLWWFCVKDGL